MFLEMEDFDFCPNQSNLAQILPNLLKLCPKFAQVLFKFA